MLLALITLPLSLACASTPMDAQRGDGSSSPQTDAGVPRGDGGGSTDAPASSGQSANALACARLKAGPFTPMTAKVMPTYRDPAPPIQHGQAYRVTLPAPPRSGNVGFKVPAAGEYVIYTSRSLPVYMFTGAGTAILAKSVAASIPECTEVKDRESFDLTTDTEAHVIRLGGDSATGVDVVISPAQP
jgi:hypothetical protein